MLSQIDYILIAVIFLLLIIIFNRRCRRCDHFEDVKTKKNFVSLPLDQQISANTIPLKGAINSAIDTINTNTNTGLTTVLNQCLSTIQLNNTALQTAAAATCSAQLQSLSDIDLFVVQDVLSKALADSQASQTSAVNTAITAIQNAVNRSFSAPGFFVKYVNPLAGSYRAWTAFISLDGNTIMWNSWNGVSHGTWSRAIPLSSSQDPTIISGGELPITQIPSEYSNQTNINTAGDNAITTFNWLNTSAKWPVLITPVPNTSNTYYMKQGKHFDPVVDQLIVI